MSSPGDATAWNSCHLSADRLLEGGDSPLLLKKEQTKCLTVVKVIASKIMVVSNSEVPV